MKIQRRSVTFITAVALAGGLSSTLVVAAPADATPFTCGLGGTSLGAGVCELTYTSGSATFTPPAGTTKLEALLVGGGGGSYGGYGGGGGQVSLVNFADKTTPIDLTVAPAGATETDGVATTTTQGTTTTTAAPGKGTDGPNGGDSGNGNAGWSSANWATTNDDSGAGAGDGASPADTQDGGAGATAGSLAPAGSLFVGDTNCYGGGGGVLDALGNAGTATCGGGYEQLGVGNVDAVPNSGGGGGTLSFLYTGSEDPSYSAATGGASGVVVIRWLTTAPSTVTFVMNGHGTQVPMQEVITDTTATQPPTPSASGVIFGGWYSDPGLATPFNFSDPVTTDSSLYASWIAAAAVHLPIVSG